MENNRKPLIYYWLIAIAVMALINLFVLPFFSGQQVQEVGYNVFLDELEAQNIDQVEVNEDVIYYSLKEEPSQDTTVQLWSSQDKILYCTVRMQDAMLVDRLYEAGANFTAITPKEVSPWISTLVMFFLFFLL